MAKVNRLQLVYPVRVAPGCVVDLDLTADDQTRTGVCLTMETTSTGVEVSAPGHPTCTIPAGNVKAIWIESQPEAAGAPVEHSEDDTPAPTPKKRGRPRKAQ